MSEKIKGVLFDIGGVIVRTEDSGPRLRLAARYGLDRAGIDALVFGSPAAQAAERGVGGEAAVWEHVRGQLQLSEHDLAVFQRDFWAGDRADSSFLLLLGDLRRRGLRTGFLTNSWLMDPLPLFWTRFGAQETVVRAAVDVAVSSARVGIQKPAERIYQAALEDLQTQPAETVFVDDFVHNVAAARELGLHAIHFESATQARRDLLVLLKA